MGTDNLPTFLKLDPDGNLVAVYVGGELTNAQGILAVGLESATVTRIEIAVDGDPAVIIKSFTGKIRAKVCGIGNDGNLHCRPPPPLEV